MSYSWEVRCRCFDRREGKSAWNISKIVASSQASAISKASRAFMSSLTRKERRDAAICLEITASKLIIVDGKLS